MNRFFKSFCPGAIAFIFAACSDDPVIPPDPCANPPVISGMEVTKSSCGNEGGSVVVEASGGNGNVLYSLNGKDYQESGIFTNVPEGTYTLTVKDEEDCVVSQQLVIEEEKNGMEVSIASTTNSGCGLSEGSVTLAAEGGGESVQYSLDGDNFQSEPAFRGLAAGEFTAYVKNADGCLVTSEFELKTGISYNASVKDIIKSNCAISGCHVAGTGRANFEEFAQVKNNASTILSYTRSGHMPPASSGKKLSTDELQAIACWVHDGAPQN